MGVKLGGHELPFEAILVQVRQFDTAQKPNIANYKQCILKSGPRAYRVATYFTIRNQHTGEVHHHALKFQTFTRTKARGWETSDEENTFTISDKEGQDEIQNLFDFLSSSAILNAHGDYIVLNSESIDQKLKDVLTAVSSSQHRAALIGEILSWVDTDPTANVGLIKLATEDPHRSESLVAALNYGRYLKALSQFELMIEQNLPEQRYQKFLEENFWMFGSEYSQLIDKRTLTVGKQLDFPLRRTVDGYLEVIEIKTPLGGKPLFRSDPSHNTLFAGPELSMAEAQADNYLSLLDADQYRIEVQEKLKVNKVRAKIVIGRNGDEVQVKAVRERNAGLLRREIITYDQLVGIAKRILAIMAERNPTLKELPHTVFGLLEPQIETEEVIPPF